MHEELVNKKDYKENYKSMSDKIDKLSTDLNEFEKNVLVKIAELPEAILDKCDSRYAGKRIEKIVWVLLSACCIAFLGIVIELINN